jgi:DNA transformation protein and related proteins
MPRLAAVPSALVDHCLELLAPLGAVRARRMFGGHGLYVDDLFIAIVAFERLYLKADAATQPAFTAAGCAPFVYAAQGKAVSLNYWTVPAEAMESPDLMQPWARQAIAAALRARAAKPAAPARKARAAQARPAPAASRSRR